MNVRLIATLHAFALAGLATLAVAADPPPAASKDCTGFKFDLQRELALFAGKPEQIKAGGAKVSSDRLYAVQLAPQAGVRFAVAPGKTTVDDGSFAGVVGYTPTRSGLLQITLSEAAWIDVVANGAVVESNAHTGSAACSLLHKSVRFSVTRGIPVQIQISGNTEQELRLTVTEPG